MAALLFLHGLTTPFVFFELNGVVSLTGGLTLRSAASSSRSRRCLPSAAPSAVRPLLWLLGSSVVLILTLGVLALVEPSLVPPVPAPRSTDAIMLLVAGLAVYAPPFLRAMRTFRLTQARGRPTGRDRDRLAGGGARACARPGLPQPRLVARARIRARRDRAGGRCGRRGSLSRLCHVPPLFGDLRAVELVTSEEAFLGSHVRALLVSLADKDISTEEHTRRVALRAVEVGEELGLPPSRLRGLALGGLLHDMGKLAVPREVLCKPGTLTDAEFDVVEASPGERRTGAARSVGFPSRRSASSVTITSVSTARATWTASRATRSTSTRASSPSATSTTHSSPRASTASPGHTSARSRTSATPRDSTSGAWVRSSGSSHASGRRVSPSRSDPAAGTRSRASHHAGWRIRAACAGTAPRLGASVAGSSLRHPRPCSSASSTSSPSPACASRPSCRLPPSRPRRRRQATDCCKGSQANAAPRLRGPDLDLPWKRTACLYGVGPVPRNDPRIVWRYPRAGNMCAPSRDETGVQTWCGIGWTGQPNVITRPGGRVEVRVGAFDRAYHFVDGASGRRVRPPLPTGDLAKGSATSDPDGYPLYYAGSRDNRLRVVALDRRRPTVLWSLDSHAGGPVVWNDDWDGAPLVVDGHLLVGGENSWFYVIRPRPPLPARRQGRSPPSGRGARAGLGQPPPRGALRSRVLDRILRLLPPGCRVLRQPRGSRAGLGRARHASSRRQAAAGVPVLDG